MEDTRTVEVGPSPLRRIWGVFMAPRATFSTIAQSIHARDILIPLLVLLALSVGSQQLLRPLAFAEQEQRIFQLEDISEEQREAILDSMDKARSRMAGLLGVVIGVVTTVAWYAIVTVIVMFFGTFILGGQGTFRISWVMVLYANMVGLLEMAVKIPLMLRLETLQVETGLALLLPVSLDGSLIYRFAHRLDFFAMWKIFLVAMGMALVYRVPEKHARAVLYGAWAVAMFLLAWLIDGRGMG